MDMAKEIEKLIKSAICVQDIAIINESHLHAGHAGDNGSGQTHFKLKVVSSDFSNLSKLQQQKTVMKAVKALFDNDLHALSIQTFATKNK